MVCHYPPGASKWNPIEHRLFSFISINWAAHPLRSLKKMLTLIRGTQTQTGLRVKATELKGDFPLKVKVSNEEMAQLNLEERRICPQWNYCLKPRRLREQRAQVRWIHSKCERQPPPPSSAGWQCCWGILLKKWQFLFCKPFTISCPSSELLACRLALSKICSAVNFSLMRESDLVRVFILLTINHYDSGHDWKRIFYALSIGRASNHPWVAPKAIALWTQLTFLYCSRHLLIPQKCEVISKRPLTIIANYSPFFSVGGNPSTVPQFYFSVTESVF